MTFKIIAYLMTVGGCILGLRFIFAGAAVLKEWGIEVTDGSSRSFVAGLAPSTSGSRSCFFLDETPPRRIFALQCVWASAERARCSRVSGSSNSGLDESRPASSSRPSSRRCSREVSFGRGGAGDNSNETTMISKCRVAGFRWLPSLADRHGGPHIREANDEDDRASASSHRRARAGCVDVAGSRVGCA